jgi:hypothetical protein
MPPSTANENGRGIQQVIGTPNRLGGGEPSVSLNRLGCRRAYVEATGLPSLSNRNYSVPVRPKNDP